MLYLCYIVSRLVVPIFYEGDTEALTMGKRDVSVNDLRKNVSRRNC